MNHPHIIGLTGPAGCGKDTVALLLATHLRFSALAFADALRSEVCNGFRIDLSLLTRRDLKEQPTAELALERCVDNAFIGVMLKHFCVNGEHAAQALVVPRSARQIMQWWGTEYRRHTVREDYWTRTLQARVHIQQQGNKWCQARHVISDVRFDNEARAIRDMGGAIWQVKRPDLAQDTAHISETDGSRFKPDAIINNRHTIKHLQLLVMGAWMMSETGLGHDDLVGMGAAFAGELVA
jgi:cytidylate kinase